MTPSTSTAYSTAASTELLFDPYGGTRLPTLRTQNWSPGPVVVIMFGTIRESAQVMNNCVGR